MDEKNRIRELYDEVEAYKQAIQEAWYALQSAEAELDEALEAERAKPVTKKYDWQAKEWQR